jgi:hypothetical protein
MVAKPRLFLYGFCPALFSTLIVRYMYFGLVNPEMTRLIITASKNRGRGIAFDMLAIKGICGSRCRLLQENF